MRNDADSDDTELRRRTFLRGSAGGLAAGVLGTTLGTSAAESHEGDGQTVTIIHDTHFHGRFTDAGDEDINIARFHSIVEALRNEHDNAAFFGIGDDLAPSLLGLQYEGEHMVEALNYMEPDAVGAGNHEFDFGVETAIQRFQESDFPWLAANLSTPEGDPVPGTERWTTIDVGDVTVGVFGLGVDNFSTITDYPEDWGNQETIEAARDAVEALEDEADFIVGALHVSSGVKRTIAEEVDGIDALVGSHSGATYDSPDKLGDTTVSEFGDEYDHIGRLTFDVETGELVDWERLDLYNSAALEEGEELPEPAQENHRIVDVQDVEEDAELATIAEEYQSRLQEELSQPIVESEVELDARFNSNYPVETGLGNLITDLMREVGDDDLEVDAAFQNAGGIRSNSVYGPGEITGEDIQNILPFPNEIQVYELTGAQLRDFLEAAMRPMPGDFGAQPALQASGVQFEWFGHFDDAEIYDVYINGEPLDEEATYNVATNDFVANREFYEDSFGEAELILDSGQFQGPFVTDRLEERETIAPEVENRIVRVDANLGEVESLSLEDDEVVAALPYPSDRASGLAPAEEFSALTASGEEIAPTAVERDGDTIVVRFDAADMEAAASTTTPGIRIFGGYEPDTEFYDYEAEEQPVSAAYDYYRLRSAVPTEDARALFQNEDEGNDSDTDESNDSGGMDDDDDSESMDETEDEEEQADGDGPGFGPAAAVAGTGGAAYLLSERLGTDNDESEE